MYYGVFQDYAFAALRYPLASPQSSFKVKGDTLVFKEDSFDAS